MAALMRSIRCINERSIFIKFVSCRYGYGIMGSNAMLTVGHNRTFTVSPQRTNTSWITPAVKQQFFPIDQQIQYLDKYFKACGALPKRPILNIVEYIRRTGHIDSLQVLQTIRYCGLALVEASANERNAIIKDLWDLLYTYNIPMDVSHYNVLLQAYLENDYEFSPIEFLMEMKNKDISPNKVTYQRLVEYYCTKGNMHDTVKVLETMKEENISLNESIFNSLIVGHSETGNIEGAELILDMMKNNNIEPSSDTYANLMCAYAKQNNMDKIREILQKREVCYTNKNILDVTYALIKNKHLTHVEEMLNYIVPTNSFPVEELYFITKLIDIHEMNIAFNLILNLLSNTRDYNIRNRICKALFKRMIDSNVESSVLGRICSFLENKKLCNYSFYYVVNFLHDTADITVTLEILKYWNKTHSIKPHYFWPILNKRGKQYNFQGILDTVDCMKTEFNVLPCFDTIQTFILPYNIENIHQLRKTLLKSGISDVVIDNAVACYFLSTYKEYQCISYMSTYNNVYHSEQFVNFLPESTYRTDNADSFVTIVKMLQDTVIGPYTFNSVTENVNSLMSIHPPKRNLVLMILRKLKKEGVKLERQLLHNAENYLGEVALYEDKNVSTNYDEMVTHVDYHINTIIERQKRGLHATELQKKLLLYISNQNNKELMLHAIQKFESLAPLSPFLFDAIINFYCNLHDTNNAKIYVKKLFDSKPVNKRFYEKALKKYVRLLLKQNATDDLRQLFEVAHKHQNWFWFEKFFSSLICETDLQESNMCLNILKSILETSHQDPYIYKFIILTNAKLGNLEDAIQYFEKCCTMNKRMEMLPLMRAVVQHDDPDLLKKFKNICFLYFHTTTVATCFLQCFIESSKLYQAKSYIENYSLSIHTQSIRKLLSHYVFTDNVTSLMRYLKLTEDVSYADRLQTYEFLLHNCDIKNNWSIGLELWSQMQQENCIPSKAFLDQLASLLENNKIPVPFNSSHKNITASAHSHAVQKQNSQKLTV